MVPASASLRDGNPDGAAFGEFLRQARERRGLTLQQISSETKIPWRHLDALEHGQLNAVPGGMYRRGEIRAYAEVVGIDKALALERLDRALQSTTAPVVVPQQKAPRELNRGFAITALALLVIASAVWPVLWKPSAVATPAASERLEPIAATPVAVLSQSEGLAKAVRADAPAIAAPVSEVSAPAAPADPAAPAASLAPGFTITSDPPGARVTVDGIAWGVTPVTIHHLAPGDRRVRLTLPAFAAAERTVRMSGDRTSGSLHVVLDGAPPR